MAYAIEQLRKEHGNLMQLLRLLEHQVGLFESGQSPDYELIQSIAEYFATFPDSCHHPKEDLIFAKLKERNPQAAQTIGELEEEHEAVGDGLSDFRKIIDEIMLDMEIPRDKFAAAARRFIEEQRTHVLMEERHFFPQAMSSLSEEDWSEIDAKLTQQADPLFDSAVEDRFRELRRKLVAWAEDLANQQSV